MQSISPSGISRPSRADDVARGRRTVSVILTLWFVASTWIGASGVLGRLPPFAVPVAIWGSFACWFAIYRMNANVRAALAQVPLVVPIAYQAVVRTGYGIGILVAGARGGFPDSFTHVAGPGDVVSGLLALFAIAFLGRTDAFARRVVLAWNWIALFDILVVFVVAQRVLLFGAGVRAFPSMFEFPFAWLPTFVLPTIFAAHVWVFARLRPAAR